MNHRTISINYTDYLVPEDMSTKQLSDLLAAVLALRPIDSRGRDIAGKWTTVHYLANMRVATGTTSFKVLCENEAQALNELDHLEHRAAMPEAQDAF